MMKYLIFLALSTSCSFLEKAPSLIDYDKEKLLDSIQLTGEGKGRLTLGQSKYLFAVDSVLNNNYDWILAVSMPVHGEEVLVFSNLKDKSINAQDRGSLELRIINELRHLKLDRSVEAEIFMNELRSLIRFNLARYWGQKRDCKQISSEFICTFDGEDFHVNVARNEITVNKFFSKKGIIQLSAKNFNNFTFGRTDILFFKSLNDLKKRDSDFSLEFFW